MSIKNKIILYGIILFLSVSFFGINKVHADWGQETGDTLSTNTTNGTGGIVATGTIFSPVSFTGLKLKLSASSTSHINVTVYAWADGTKDCGSAYLDPTLYTMTLNPTSDFGGIDVNPINYNENLYTWTHNGTTYYASSSSYPTVPTNYNWCIQPALDYSGTNLRAYGTTIESGGSNYLISQLTGIVYPYFVFKGTIAPPPSATIQMQIIFPVNTTSTYIHDFNYFNIVATNTDAYAHDYSFRIVTDTSSTFDNHPMWNFIAPVHASSTATMLLSIPNAQDLSNTSTTQIYYSKLCTTIDGNSNDITCTDPIAFNLGLDPVGFKANTLGVGFNGRTLLEAELGILPDSNMSCEDNFWSPSQWSCVVKREITGFINLIAESWKAGLNKITTDVNTVFPMSVIGTLKDDISLVTATTTDHKIVLTGQGTAFKKKGGGYNSFTFLSSSTIKTAEANSGLPFETLIVNIIYLADAIIIIGGSFMILHHRTKKHA